MLNICLNKNFNPNIYNEQKFEKFEKSKNLNF